MNTESHSFANQTASISGVWHYTTGAFSLLCLLCGVFTNGLVICVFIRNKKLRRPRNYFHINLAVSDLGLLVTNNTLHTIASFNKRWLFGQIGCDLYALCGGIFGLTSIATMVAIAITRLAVVMDPFSSLNLTARCMLKYVLFSWIYGSIWMIPPLFDWNRFVFEGFHTTCTFDYLSRETWDRLYILILFIGGFLVPLVVILVSYSIILMKLSRRSVSFTYKTGHQSTLKTHACIQTYSFPSTHSRAEEPNENHQLSHTLRRTEVRAARTALLILSVYCAAWGPYAFVAILSQVGFTSFLNVYTTTLLGLLTKIAACINPLIYAFSSSRYRHQICILITLCRLQKRQLPSAFFSTTTVRRATFAHPNLPVNSTSD